MKENKRFFLWCGIISPIIMVQATVVLGAIREEYSHVQHTVSELGSPGFPYADFFNAAFIAFGILILLFSVGVWFSLERRKGAAISLAIIGLLNILGGIFPVDMELLESPSSQIHIFTGMLMFVTFIVAMFLFTTATKQDVRFSRTKGLLNIFWILGLLGILGTLVDQNWTGLAQRLFYLGLFGILAVLGAGFLRKTQAAAE